MKTTTSTLSRNDFGALHASTLTSDDDRAGFLSAMSLVAQASKSGKIPAEFDDMEWGRSGRERGHKIGEARYHEIYDFTASAVLVCARSVEGTKYGQKTTLKEYFLISRKGRGVTVSEASKALAAKAAKASGALLGAAIAVIQGKAVYTAPANKGRGGYKLVERSESGLVSVWDGSDWSIGKTRVEAATEDHRGGFYYYASLDEALSAASVNETFGDAHQHRRLVVVEVEASGRHFKHGGAHGTKLCASRIKPVREVAMTV